MRKVLGALTAGLFLLTAGGVFVNTSAAAGPPDGRTLFEKKCTGCHALDRDKVGPRLAGVFGRKSAAVASYSYSDGLKAANIAWDAKTLDRWLADPDGVVRDNDMSFRLENSAERAAIVDYLRQLTDQRKAGAQ